MKKVKKYYKTILIEIYKPTENCIHFQIFSVLFLNSIWMSNETFWSILLKIISNILEISGNVQFCNGKKNWLRDKHLIFLQTFLTAKIYGNQTEMSILKIFFLSIFVLNKIVKNI